MSRFRSSPPRCCKVESELRKQWDTRKKDLLVWFRSRSSLWSERQVDANFAITTLGSCPFENLQASCQARPMKTTAAPAAISVKPAAWFQPRGSFSTSTEKPAKTRSVITSWIVFSSAAE